MTSTSLVDQNSTHNWFLLQLDSIDEWLCAPTQARKIYSIGRAQKTCGFDSIDAENDFIAMAKELAINLQEELGDSFFVSMWQGDAS
ncbi:hypothetical protein UNDKW_4385 [Undibacterium sp. KW1]|uniref:hypothetical protein n=1 Tax=Undibacterium sp. KW1 TaxID=2058624 RepID=UPI001331E88E|nr:hypothetical protein [Undibacterium sp. KW1]BBB62658.1 hypothetical protein UNDKW_4385 [Undibacterium sp. KW1]